MHNLLDRVVVHLGHHILLTADAIGDTSEKLQLAPITHLSVKDIVQRLDDFR